MAMGESIPSDVLNALTDDSVIKWAFNAQFERICLSKYIGKHMTAKAWRCTMVWAATLGQTPDFYYEHSFWQYSVTGSVAGIEGDVDMDMMFTPIISEDMNNGQA